MNAGFSIAEPLSTSIATNLSVRYYDKTVKFCALFRFERDANPELAPAKSCWISCRYYIFSDVLDRSGLLFSEGRYFVLFKTPIGEGASEVELLPNGDLKGSDTNFSYAGHWAQVAGRFKADIRAKRFAPGPPGVFGLDEIDIVVTGLSTSEEVLSGSGFAKQAPALKLSITFSRMDSG